MGKTAGGDSAAGLGELLKAIREFRKFTDQPVTPRGGDYALHFKLMCGDRKGVWTAVRWDGQHADVGGSDYAHAVQELNKATERAEPGCAAKMNVAIAHYSKQTKIFRIENSVRAAYNRGVEKSVHARPNRLNQ